MSPVNWGVSPRRGIIIILCHYEILPTAFLLSYNPFSYWIAELLKGISILTPSLSTHGQFLSLIHLFEVFVKHYSQGLSKSLTPLTQTEVEMFFMDGLEKWRVTCHLSSPHTFSRSCEQEWGSAKRRQAGLWSGTTVPCLVAIIFSGIINLWFS